MRFSRRLARACPAFILTLSLCLPGPTLGASGTFEFLYINANEGSASGGHAAIRFGDEVFHFQHVPPGLLRIAKESYGRFRFEYGDRENRTIRVHRIEAPEETVAWLDATFNRRLLIQDEHYAALDAMDEDIRLLDALLAAPPRTVELKGLGYFHTRPKQTGPQPMPAEAPSASDSTRRLHAAAASLYGQNFLARKRQETRARLLALGPVSSGPAASEMAEDRFSPAGYSFSQRYADALTDLAALDVLEQGRAPCPDAILQPDSPEFRLSRAALAALENYRQTLTGDLLGLLRSERADWGYPFLVGLARLHALDRSIATGRLAILDRFQAGGGTAANEEAGGGVKAGLLDQARAVYASAQSELTGGQAPDERRYARLEESANLFLEIRQSLAQARPIRPLPAGATPARAAPAGVIALPLAAGQLAAYRLSLAAERDAYTAKLMSLYAYKLISRNCVTEIFRVINGAIAGRLDENGGADAPDAKLARVRAESERLLGGYVDETGANLVPFVAYASVGDAYRVRSSADLPAYRDVYLSQEYRRAAPWLVNLQESNVLSSAIYRWHGDDAAFLFFTQDTVWNRPLLGSINLAVALGQTLTGLLALPWDSGENLRLSLKGVFVSIPELFFFNIRKGSFPYLTRMSPGS
ncbi:hypothetical protein [Methylococcus sp. EFPC2]|uniref:hypothetical protein n=1 Tax=Methylococcus sp. EFPC2 TaxID=2812648 RepID=UPI0019674F54|nr:hypothetical protein [Methylococcus sp. EFPC2]QSA96318.1 hypothetical protein JWZ97_13955 [Methylococcus sp. EFPC2]